MKIKTLLTKAKKELKTQEEEDAVALIKCSLKEITQCKKTLKKLEKAHDVLLESDLDDLELDDLIY